MEAQRNKTVESLEPLDDLLVTPEPEPAFDDLAALAGWVCGASVAAIALRDRGDPRLKAGIGVPLNATDYLMKLCTRALAAEKSLVIADTRADSNSHPPLRFFAGVPLVMQSGRRAGVLAVADAQPRALDAVAEQRLLSVAGQIIAHLEMRRLLAELARTIGERHDLETALRASQERYRELFQNASDIVYTHDLAEHFTSINAAGERITGYTSDEVLKMNFAELVAPEYLELARQMMAHKLAGEPPRMYEVEILAKDGHRIALELSTRLVRHEGKPLAIQGIARDVSERRRAQAELREANDKLQMQVAEMEQHTRETTVMNEMGDLLQICLAPGEAYDVIARTARDLFAHYSGGLMILDAHRNVVETVGRWGDSLHGDESFTPEDCWALRRGRAHRVESEAVGPLCRHAGPNFRGSTLCVPMMAQGEALGVMHLQGAGGAPVGSLRMPINSSVERLAVTLADHVSLALANLRLRETLRNQSIRDPLTGLFNRRYLEASLLRELARAARKQRPLGIIMMDVDHFKKFNDTFGHQAGDALLRELGAFLQRHTRGDDIACRYGGEEFTVILPEAPLEVSRQRAEHMCEEVRTLASQGDPERAVTISFGVAGFPEHGVNAMDLLRAADRALYRAKSAGRNRVMLADGLAAPSQPWQARQEQQEPNQQGQDRQAQPLASREAQEPQKSQASQEPEPAPQPQNSQEQQAPQAVEEPRDSQEPQEPA
ncbi:MAG: diguanylate cyclase [Candidatus Acidiferrales bacterium]